jgi:hypothetical protein
MPEGIIGAVWALCWGLAAASGALVGAILGLITHLRHRAIAAFMSVGAGVLLSAASFKVASEALMLAGAASAVAGIVAGAATLASRRSSATAGPSAAGNAGRSLRKRRYRAAAPPLRSAPRLMLCRRR